MAVFDVGRRRVLSSPWTSFVCATAESVGLHGDVCGATWAFLLARRRVTTAKRIATPSVSYVF